MSYRAMQAIPLIGLSVADEWLNKACLYFNQYLFSSNLNCCIMLRSGFKF